MSTTFFSSQQNQFSYLAKKRDAFWEEPLSDNLIIVTNPSDNVNNFFETISQELNDKYYDTNVSLNRQQVF